MSAPPVTEAPLLLNLMDAVSTAHALAAAIEVGLIDQLTSGPKEINELAHVCATDPSMTALLLDALAGLGLVRRDALGLYALAIDLLPLLRTLIRSWSELSVVARSGEPLVRADTAEGASDLYPDFLPVLSAMFAPAARRAAQLLSGCGTDVLDVGAGEAPWSIALATSSPAVQVTALDLPAVIATTQRAVDAANVGDRFDYLSGDMFTCELAAAAYDVVLLANVCHLFDETHNRVLLRRLRSALRPGGWLAIIDVLTSRDPAEQCSISLYALSLRLRTSSGTVYPIAAYETWTNDAGFGPLQVEPLSAQPSLTLLTCRTT
ncbi:MAG TPA: class I SAM-dependent methyltransferase [Mycobacterium sp.]|nr:class I SAM-dependent methyltransferase [Mycobacterium sp.]